MNLYRISVVLLVLFSAATGKPQVKPAPPPAESGAEPSSAAIPAAPAGALAEPLAQAPSVPGPPVTESAAPPVSSGAVRQESESRASPFPTDFGAEDMAALSLEELLSITVTTATKTEATTLERSPSVITVITRREIESRGYTSLAQALRTVPGFYDVYDLVTHNIGVRGVNGGARASGSVVKLLIDGLPVSYRASTGNFFGEESIPMEVVDRIEILRGPGSALYGANAFLGVINVITRPSQELAGLRLVGQAGAIRGNPAVGGGLVVGGADASNRVSVLAAVQTQVSDRSGLMLPDSSPYLERRDAPPYARDVTHEDEARPASIFAKAAVKSHEHGEVSVMTSVQNLDAHGSFQDFGPLSETTRVHLVNESYRLAYQLTPSESVSLRLSVNAFRSQPGRHDELDVGNPDYVLLRRVGVRGTGGLVEAGLTLLGGDLRLAAGADFDDERHTLQAFDKLLTKDVFADDSRVRTEGTTIPGDGSGRSKRLTNLGAFVQAIYNLGEDWSTTAGLRLDDHSLYGQHLSPRVAAVFAPKGSPMHVKVLFGSSFKAPSAEQLFTMPMNTLDIKGSESLEPQKAYTLELVGGYVFGELAQVLVNAFATRIENRVEFVQRGLYLTAENMLRETIAGGELDTHLWVDSRLTLRLSLGLAYTLSSGWVTDEVIVGTLDAGQPLFPVFQAHGAADYSLPFGDLSASLEASYIGPRSASQSNALERGYTYELPAYALLSAALATPSYHWLGLATRANLRVCNLLGTEYSDPGFGGVDVPALGRTVMLTLVQDL